MNAHRKHTLTGRRRSGGFSLIEALVAITLFSMGILGMVGLQALSIKSAGDAKYRADAAYLANQIISQMWVDRSAISGYAYSGGTAAAGTGCAVAGGGGGNANTNAWTTEVSRALPSGSGSIALVSASTTTGSVTTWLHTVTVSVCWTTPDTGAHIHTALARIDYP
jgi:type IV pilus assembly protein PilV